MAAGTDRLTVVLAGLCGFLLLFAALAMQLPAAPATPQRHVLVLRRVYRTTVIETLRDRAGASSSATQVSSPVTQSVSSSGGSVAAAPTTRTS